MNFEDGAVTEDDDASPSDRRQPAETSTGQVGAYVTVEATRQVIVKVGGVARVYTLIIPGDGVQCILASGRSDSADLEQSWFGAIEDDPDTATPEYRHASLRRSHPTQAFKSASNSGEPTS